MPDAPGLELIAHELDEAARRIGPRHLPRARTGVPDRRARADPGRLGWLRDTPGQEYRFLASLHGVDYLPAEPRFGVVYELLNMPRVERLRVRAALDDPGEG